MLKRAYEVIQCNKCQEWVPFGRFCCNCGTVQPHTKAEREARECTYCRNIVAVGTYCPKCGMRVDIFHSTQNEQREQPTKRKNGGQEK